MFVDVLVVVDVMCSLFPEIICRGSGGSQKPQLDIEKYPIHRNTLYEVNKQSKDAETSSYCNDVNSEPDATDSDDEHS